MNVPESPFISFCFFAVNVPSDAIVEIVSFDYLPKGKNTGITKGGKMSTSDPLRKKAKRK